MKSNKPEITALFDQSVPFDTILDEIPIGVVILDKDRRIAHTNKAVSALTGYSPQEARGVMCHNIIRSRICLKKCPVLRLKEDSEPICEHTDLINRGRELVEVRITFAPITSGSGELIGYLETLEDIRALQNRTSQDMHGFRFSEMIGKGPQMEKVFQMLPLLAQNDSSVLITGETGTGKDLTAEAIHKASNRARGPFIKINCGALPETLLESELFGHQKGAFTDAKENKPGRFRLAHNGSLYLTEIGDLPLSLQVKLLTFLDDRVVFPLGSTKGFEVNVRIIAGTNQNLERMVENGSFRKDLLFRLNVVRITLPPLREREDDIVLLIDHFLNTFAEKFSKKIEGFDRQTLYFLNNYHFPGNVRELRNIVEYAVNVSQDSRIGIESLPTYLMEPDHLSTIPTPVSGVADQDASPLAAREATTVQVTGSTWAKTEKQMIINALVKTGGKKQKTADLLGWGRSTLWRKMKQYGI
jgi:two-component system response regulator AtoC